MIPPLLRRLALALLLALALVAGASALDGYTYSQTVEYAACDQAVYQQDLVIHRSAGTAYEETSGGLNIWHLYVGTDCQADYGDLRFTDAAGTELDYWLQPGYDSSSARFCVRLTGATSADSVTAWYGNAGATSESSSGVFDLYHGAATTQFYDSPSLVFSSMIYEASVRRTSTGNINTLLGVANGLFTAPSSDDAMIQLDTDTAKVYYYSTNEGSRRSLSKSFSFEVNTYYNVKLVHNGTHIVGYIDNIAINTAGIGGGYLPNEQVGLFFHPIFAGVGDQAWSCVRRYSAAPPAATAFLTGAAPETPPVAAFTASPTTGAAPLTVQFTDTSTYDPTAWSWTFGDGGTSDQQHPSHTYTVPGTYPVALTVTNPGGSDTLTRAGYITVSAPVLPPVADFSAAPTTGTAPLTVKFTDASTNAPTGYFWTFGDGRTSIAQSPSHTYSTAGTYNVSLTATNAGGSDTETKTGYITVSAPPPTAPPTAANSPAFPYSQQRKETLSFLLMCWGALAFVGVFCVVIFLLMNGAQRGSGGI